MYHEIDLAQLESNSLGSFQNENELPNKSLTTALISRF